ncbi:DUF6069 family protein [Streptomonospora wellingtoniae]|uniref:DUF6069 family protein n=1 Tax=Streptomonospora wellingtoniae TaxID=3075544 RepID=A0ABU2KV78_9ACTN|nr:DUF6069 family protein [Streptomonospora sp. DSM 45055]MDT0303194.1 DUF6069 family protein [Streptomonospora sp. DSM 45055]
MSEDGNERRVNTVRLWSGGLATAVVAALIILVGTLIARGVLGIAIPAPEEGGYIGGAGTAAFAATAGIAALVATALLHLLLVSAPRATVFFGWIVGLATVVAAVSPFTESAPLSSQLATAVINTVTGIAIVSLLISVGATAVRRRRGRIRRDGPEGAEFDDSGYSSGYRDALGQAPERRSDGRHRGEGPYAPGQTPHLPRE